MYILKWQTNTDLGWTELSPVALSCLCCSLCFYISVLCVLLLLFLFVCCCYCFCLFVVVLFFIVLCLMPNISCVSELLIIDWPFVFSLRLFNSCVNLLCCASLRLLYHSTETIFVSFCFGLLLKYWRCWSTLKIWVLLPNWSWPQKCPQVYHIIP
jgi:hypothetical protein